MSAAGRSKRLVKQNPALLWLADGLRKGLR
jgi:hypothetical protein